MAANENRIKSDVRVVFVKAERETAWRYWDDYRSNAGLNLGLRFVKMRKAPGVRVLVVKVIAGTGLRATVTEERFKVRDINAKTGKRK